ESADITFGAGLTVITGPSGSGKSLILGAIQMVLGDRADPARIRPGAERMDVLAQFNLTPDTKAYQWLMAHHFEAKNTCIIKRTINRDGRSKAWINDAPISLQQLKALSECLIQLHGQHQHLTLVKAHEQRRLLDVFAKNHQTLAQVQVCYQNWLALIERKEGLQAKFADPKHLDLLTFQYEELSTAAPRVGEWETLKQQQQRLANSAEYEHAGHSILSLLAEDDTHAVLKQLHRAQTQAAIFKDAELNS
ncbi:MAG: AAA family ATPase, partial [Pseudomonadota bacterium]